MTRIYEARNRVPTNASVIILRQICMKQSRLRELINPAVGFSNLRGAFQIASSHSWRILASLRTTVRVDTFNSFAMSSLV